MSVTITVYADRPEEVGELVDHLLASAIGISAAWDDRDVEPETSVEPLPDRTSTGCQKYVPAEFSHDAALPDGELGIALRFQGGGIARYALSRDTVVRLHDMLGRNMAKPSFTPAEAASDCE